MGTISIVSAAEAMVVVKMWHIFGEAGMRLHQLLRSVEYEKIEYIGGW